MRPEGGKIGRILDGSGRSRLVHELQVHQIELEMQNEELQRARTAAEEASEKYYDLFDFAPVGYFLWDHKGRILEVNLAGAALLGLDRNEVVQKRFGQFVAMEDRDRFADFCHRVLAADDKQTCEVKILRDGQAVYLLVEGIAAQGPQGQERLCRAAVIDITHQKRADDLATSNQALKGEIAARKQAEEEIRSLAEFFKESPYPIIRVVRRRASAVRQPTGVSTPGSSGWQAGQFLPEVLLRPARRVLEEGGKQAFDLTGRTGRTFSFTGRSKQPERAVQSLRAGY